MALAGFSAWQGNGAETNVAWPVIIPFESAHARVLVPLRINGSKPLLFLLDTGYGINLIHPDWVEPLGLKRSGRITIMGIAGDEEAATYSGAVFDFGGVTYAPRRMASLPSEAQTHHRRDGILGAGFFRRFVVEIDRTEKTIQLHEPASFVYTGKGEIIPLTFAADTPVIEATILSPAKVIVRGRFEVDTGCDDALCLGREFVETNQLAGAVEIPAGVKRGVGGRARIRHGFVPELRLGAVTLEKPAANFFSDGSPAGEGLAGHIGMGALQNYKIIFDYSRRRMILEK